jgi:hypothetical protein
MKEPVAVSTRYSHYDVNFLLRHQLTCAILILILLMIDLFLVNLHSVPWDGVGRRTNRAWCFVVQKNTKHEERRLTL